MWIFSCIDFRAVTALGATQCFTPFRLLPRLAYHSRHAFPRAFLRFLIILPGATEASSLLFGFLLPLRHAFHFTTSARLPAHSRASWLPHLMRLLYFISPDNTSFHRHIDERYADTCILRYFRCFSGPFHFARYDFIFTVLIIAKLLLSFHTKIKHFVALSVRSIDLIE